MEQKFFYITACPVIVHEENCFVGVGVDISDRRNAELKVAHEVNTPFGIGVTAASHLSDMSTELIHTIQNKKFDPEVVDILLKYLDEINILIHDLIV